jgi:hypothetical protein
LLNGTDIVTVLTHIILDRIVSEGEVFRQLEIRSQRLRATIEASNKQIEENGCMTSF